MGATYSSKTSADFQWIPNHSFTFNELHSLISQKTELFTLKLFASNLFLYGQKCPIPVDSSLQRHQFEKLKFNLFPHHGNKQKLNCAKVRIMAEVKWRIFHVFGSK
jgi:hypothetical protein